MSEYSPVPAAPPPPASGASGPRAGFWPRFAAYFIDNVLLGVVFGIVYAITNIGLAYALYFVGFFAYFAYFDGGPTGQTLGKRALGIRVYDFTQGGPIGFGRGLLRAFGLILASIPCYLGYLWMLWDKEKQGWQDKIATTVVVPVSAYPVER
jgi:uncharacterized RDD family membrane protein YckC